MKIIIYSDVHGHIRALEKLYQNESDADQFVSLGDVVGYSPFWRECLAFVAEQSNTLKVIGNHEEMYLKGRPHPSCSNLAIDFFNAAYEDLTDKENTEIESWKHLITIESYKFMHTLDQKHIYANSKFENFNITGDTFIGHSHVQFSATLSSYQLVNVGSLGQNRSQKRISQYAILRTDRKSVEFKSFESDIGYIQAEMICRSYPTHLVDYYK